MEKPSIFSYGNYRSFIDEAVKYLRAKGEFSNRSFAKTSGFKAHTYLNLIVQGKRNLSKKGSRRVAKGLHLNERESDFFCQLVEFNQTVDLKEKNKLFNSLRDFVRAELVQVNHLDQYELYSEWYHVPILESLGKDWSSPSLNSLASALELRENNIESSLKLLERLDLIERRVDRVRRTRTELATSDEVESLFVRNFHAAMIKLALERLSRWPKEEREFAGLTLPLSQKNFEVLREKIRRFNEELQKEFAEEKEPSSVYHINLQAFPVFAIPSVKPKA